MVTEKDVGAIINRYKKSSLNCLQSIVRELVEKKMVAIAQRMMVHDEAEEVSRDEIVEDFE